MLQLLPCYLQLTGYVATLSSEHRRQTQALCFGEAHAKCGVDWQSSSSCKCYCQLSQRRQVPQGAPDVQDKNRL